MNFLQFSFYLFSAILIVAASLVVTVRNPVKAALYLVLVFFSAACIWLTLEAEFLAIVLVLVYVGAVMVLFLFVVMMLDIDVARLREGFTQYLPAGLVIAGVMVAELSLVMLSRRFGLDAIPRPVARGVARGALRRPAGEAAAVDLRRDGREAGDAVERGLKGVQ